MALKPDLGPHDSLLPPLPDIKDDNIRIQVFTHRSFFARPVHIFEDHPNDLSPDNEKLEHLGDTVLGLVVTRLMLDMYPGLRVGPSTKIRALIVGNATLADMYVIPLISDACDDVWRSSLKYKLPDKLRLHPAQALTLRASTNVQADVFESFVGGLYVDQGLDCTQPWLSELFRPYVELAYNTVRMQHGLPSACAPPSPPPAHNQFPARQPLGHTDLNVTETTVGHLGLFNQHLQKANQQVEWIYSTHNPDSDDGEEVDTEMLKGIKTTPVWYVKVVVDGEHFGKGKGNTKKAARNEAAKEGLKKLGINV
ncbi:ribonuclease III [Guyanagaster necrorhizus]|uniref:Ribonuclease III n=1 Tax=Guyanagaster necrorhizus TaxID=856835 RepID=A0A9P7VVG5_9AGAR|nr:ribonuclease III [Guyanagaster necrorhizus MCA 3950]KAG7447587.1 ribonuclease III [Guyanagaster necrorhizus MCA 3950]